MAINKVNTTAEEQSFKFPKNQSSILYTADTNNITINGVNVIVDEPKRGDVMCITRYKENGVLLDADKQKVIWIDGLSIEPTQLSQEYEPVGICFAVKGNKAFVRYREEKRVAGLSRIRVELPYSSVMNDGAEHTLRIKLGRSYHSNPLVLTAADTASRKAFVDKLNKWFLVNSADCSAELVELDTDLPAVDTSDVKDGDSYRNRVIVSLGEIGYAASNFEIEEIGTAIRTFADNIKSVGWCYRNNGFISKFSANICCRAMYYDRVQADEDEKPTQPVPHIDWMVRLVDFNDSPYCQILRDNFANYDEFFDSMMIKYPCGAGGDIIESPSGKENTYKLASCTYLDNTTGNQEILYPAANWAASISLNAPKLGKGNWWLPSAAEMAQMMRDVTYGTSFWETEPDIVNRVIAKLTSISNSGWSMLSANTYLLTSSVTFDKGSSSLRTFYIYNINGSLTYSNISNIGNYINNITNEFDVFSITIYEF